MENENKKEITVISGDGKNLNISPVSDNLDIAKPDVNEKIYQFYSK